MNLRIFPAALGLCLLAFASSGFRHAFAATTTIVAPNALENVEGVGGNCIPLTGCIAADRYQQVYDSSQFSALSGPELITQIAFRPDLSQSQAQR